MYIYIYMIAGGACRSVRPTAGVTAPGQKWATNHRQQTTETNQKIDQDAPRAQRSRRRNQVMHQAITGSRQGASDPGGKRRSGSARC